MRASVSLFLFLFSEEGPLMILYDFLAEHWTAKVPKARRKADGASHPKAGDVNSAPEPGAGAQGEGEEREAKACPEAGTFEEEYPIPSDLEEETPEVSSGDVTPTSSIRVQENELLAFTLGGDLLSPARKERPRLVERTPSSPTMLQEQIDALEPLVACMSVVCQLRQRMTQRKIELAGLAPPPSWGALGLKPRNSHLA